MEEAHLHAAAAVAAAANQVASAAAATAATLADAAVAGVLGAAGVPAAVAVPAVVAAAVAAAVVAAATEQSAAADAGSDVTWCLQAVQSAAAPAAADFGSQNHMWSPGCHSVVLNHRMSNCGPERRWAGCPEGRMLRSVACPGCQIILQERQRVKHGGMPHMLHDL